MEQCERTSLRREEPILKLVRDIAMGHAAAWQYLNPKATAESTWCSNQIKGKDAHGDDFEIGTVLDGSDGFQMLSGVFRAGEYARETLGMRDLDWYLKAPLSCSDPTGRDALFHEGEATAIIYQEKHPEAWPMQQFINRFLQGGRMEQVDRAWEHRADGSIHFPEQYDLPERGVKQVLEQALGRAAKTLTFLNTQLREGLIRRDCLDIASRQ